MNYHRYQTQSMLHLQVNTIVGSAIRNEVSIFAGCWKYDSYVSEETRLAVLYEMKRRPE